MDEIDLTDGNTKGRHVQPQGFVPSHLAAPMLRDSRRTALEYVAEGLGDIRLSAAIMDGPLAARIEGEATRLQRLVKALAAGALVAAFLAAGLVVGGPSAGRAEAAEGPEPDPVAVVSVAARTVPVVLSGRYVTARVPVTTRNRTPRGFACASVWGPTSYGQGFLGRACSPASSFTVPVTLDARYVPLGRSSLRYTDDVAPMDSPVGTVTLVARRPSAFGVGTWMDLGQGQLFVSAPVLMYSPAAGAWLPQNLAPVRVQVYGSAGWRTVATLTTNRYGYASGIVTTGGGVFRMRVVRPLGATVTATTGTTRTVVVTTEPLDVI